MLTLEEEKDAAGEQTRDAGPSRGACGPGTSRGARLSREGVLAGVRGARGETDPAWSRCSCLVSVGGHEGVLRQKGT